MLKQNLIRKFFIMAALVVGLFVSGAANNVYADGGGTIGSGTRSGLMGSGGLAQSAAPVAEQPGEFRIILEAFYKLIF